jgi:hypothetical protein
MRNVETQTIICFSREEGMSHCEIHCEHTVNSCLTNVEGTDGQGS